MINILKRLLGRKKRRLRKLHLRNEAEARHINFNIEDIEIISSAQQLKNCYVVNNTRFIISENQKLLFASNIVEDLSIKEVLRKWTACEEDYSLVNFNHDLSKLSLKAKDSGKFLSGNTISTSHYEPNNLYHFFLEAIFDLVNAHEQGMEINNIIISSHLIKKFRDLIEELFPAANIIVAENFEIILAQNLIVFGKKNCQWHWLREKSSEGKKLFCGKANLNYDYLLTLHKVLQKIIPKLQTTVLEKKKPAKNIVFLVRKSGFRNSINQDSLIELLKNKCANHNLLVINPAQLSFAEMVKIISTTDILLGQAGAALMNIIFSQNNKMQVVTWRFFDENQDDTYQKIIEGLGHQYLELPALLCSQFKLNDELPSQSKDFASQLLSESQSDLLAPIFLIDEALTKFLNS